MNTQHFELSFHLLAKFAVLIFWAILFLQSSLDKLINRKENLDYLNSVFEKSPLKNSIPILFPVITLLEFSAGACAAIGTILIFYNLFFLAKLSIVLAASSLLCLFMGQRIAKDYAGAASLAAYFIVALIGFILFI